MFELEGQAFLWYWYEGWIVLAGFALAVLLTAWLFTDSGRREGGSALWRGLMTLAVLMPIPMVMFRIGVTDAVSPELLGYLSVVGTGLAAVVGLLYLAVRAPVRVRREEPAVSRTAIGAEPTKTAGVDSETALPSGGVGETGATVMGEGGPTGAQPAGSSETKGMPPTAAETAGPVPGAPAQAWLEVKSGDRAGERLSLKAGETTVGRSSANDHVISDSTVSRRHMKISVEGDAYTVHDLGSRGGTKVDGRPVTSQQLSPGNVITIGETELVFMQVGAEEATRMVEARAAPAGEETVIAEETPPQMAWLTVRSGAGAGTTFQLQAGETTVGRGRDNNCVIEDQAVSRSHCLIRCHEGKFDLYDLASSGGTRVNGKPLVGRLLKPGDIITMGRTEMAFMTVKGEPGVEAGPPPSMPGETVILQKAPGVWAWLVVKSGSDAGKTLQLKTGDTTLGRDPGNDHTVSDQSVSRRHATVRFRDGQFILYDLGSRAGTRVNGEQLGGHTLQSGEAIAIGRTELVFSRVEAGQK